ncbi:uncharacterized protein LOC111117955 isoform X2 [Crassostrea virginica]
MKLSGGVLALIFICVAQVQGARTDCRSCKPGHYAKRHCNELHDTICARCSDGTYTPKSNTRELCFSCSSCTEGFFVIKPCTTLHDTVCGSCSEKGYNDLDSYRTACVPYRKVAQSDQPSESTTEDSIDLGSGDGELIIHHDSVHPTVIDDVIPEKETNHVTSGPQVQNETVDDEGSGEGFPIKVDPEDEFETTTATEHNLTLTTTESTPTTPLPLVITSAPTSLPETFNTTYPEKTSTTFKPNFNDTVEETTSAQVELNTTTSIIGLSSTASTTPLSSSESISTSTTESTSTLTSESSSTHIPTPEPTPGSSSSTTQSIITTQSTSSTTTTLPTTTTTLPTTTTTPQPTTTTTTAHTTQAPTTAKSKTLQYVTDRDGMVIIDMRGSTIIDLRTTPTPRPKSRTTTVKTIDLESEDNGIIIDLGKQEEDSINLPDNNINLPDSKIDTDSPVKAGALGSQKMDENDGIKIGVVVAVVVVAAIIFFVVGFLVSRYCKKKRSGSFKVKNDIENGSVKGSTATALDQHKDGGIYDEIGEEKVNPAQNGKPNGKAPSTEDVYAVPDKRKSNPPASPKLDDQVIKFIDDPDDDIESKEGDKLLEDSDEKYSSFASIPNGSVKQNGEVTSNDYVSESSPMLSSHDTPEPTEISEEVTKDNESEDADLEESPLLENPEAEASQPGTSS